MVPCTEQTKSKVCPSQLAGMSKTASPSQNPFACVPEHEVSVGAQALVACASLSGWPLGMPVNVYDPAVTCIVVVAEPSSVY